VTKRRVGDAELGRRCCVFVHFDAKGIVRPHTRDYLTALITDGFGIILVTNSGMLDAESESWLALRCALILIRQNRGYDFGAYRDGIAAFFEQRVAADVLVIANDSVYGPFTQFDSIITRMDFSKSDVWALTDSWQHRYHLQSYFVAFGPVALANPAFTAFWKGVRNVRSKWAAIRFYELRMTHLMEAGGLRCAAIWDYFAVVDALQDIADSSVVCSSLPIQCQALNEMAEHSLWCARRRLPMNPTSDLWLALLSLGFPFIKTELLRLNPSRTPNLVVWHRLVRDRAPQMYEKIILDLKLRVQREAP
jgi:hypothetical protein